jgi:hypothetical protein
MLACLDDDTRRTQPEQAGIPKVCFCEVRHRLMGAFLNAVHEFHVIAQQQVQAVIQGDPDFSRFDLLLHFAQEKKDMAKYDCIAHVESHGCAEGVQTHGINTY